MYAPFAGRLSTRAATLDVATERRLAWGYFGQFCQPSCVIGLIPDRTILSLGKAVHQRFRDVAQAGSHCDNALNLLKYRTRTVLIPIA